MEEPLLLSTPPGRRTRWRPPAAVMLALAMAAAVAITVLRSGGDGGVAQVGELGRIPMADNACYYSEPGKPPFPYCDAKLPLDERVKDIIGRLSLEEKAALLGNNAKKVASQKLPAYQWWNEALHGVGASPGVRFDGVSRNVTNFPQVIVTSQTFNKTLWGEIGRAISTEARAMFNLGQAGLTFWTPNINIIRDPRWGRGQETPGEDPVVNGDYAEHFVQGFQNSQRDPSRLKASACCKHFAAYNLENWHGQTRMNFNAVVSERDMQESYLPAFKACVTRGNVSSLMCSYNAINGVPACVDGDLMETLARDKWGFDGYITSDCGAVTHVFTEYHFRNHSREQVVQDNLKASVDIGCDEWLQRYTVDAVRKGQAQESLVDRSLANLFKVQMRLGLFDPKALQPLSSLGLESINTEYHHSLSLEAARQGMTLLKNARGALPLEKNAAEPVALIGPWVAEKHGLLGNYFGTPPFIMSLQEGVAKVSPSTPLQVLKGVNATTTGPADEELIKQAERAASTASQTILGCGLGHIHEEEGRDRDSFLLPGRQAELIERVAAAAKAASKPPVILVLFTAGSVDISKELANDHVGAILLGGYSGMFGGVAIAETLFGENNPSGKLTQSIYPESYAKSVSMLDMNMHPNKATGYPGRTYRFYTGPVVLPFGFGLSFTTFDYELVGRRDLGDALDFHVAIRNTGTRAGANVLLAFIKPPAQAASQGLDGDLQRKLVTYFRTQELAPGESEGTSIKISRKSHLVVFKSAGDSTPTPIDLPISSTNDPKERWTLELVGARPSEPMVLSI